MTKEEQRRLIAEATDRFLASKGEIKAIPTGLTVVDPSYWDALGLSERDGESRLRRERAAHAMIPGWGQLDGATPSRTQLMLHGLDGDPEDDYSEESFP